MSTVAGIDFNTRAIDIILLNEEGESGFPYRYQIDFQPGEDAFDRTRKIRAILPGRSWWDDVIAIGIEDPRGHGAGHLYRVQGAILQCLPPNVLVQPWIPSAWRKACGLPGNCPKEDVAVFVNELHGHRLGWHQDAYDAYCIAHATRSVLERMEAA